MLSEGEIKNWKLNEEARLEQIVDPREKVCARVCINTLAGVLNE